MQRSRTRGPARARTAGFSRREFFGASLIGTLVGACSGRGTPGDLAADAVTAANQAYENSIYTRMLGIKPHLAGFDHITRWGGSRMPKEVMEAMLEANDQFVDMDELTRAAGARVARVMGAEAALVTCGSFSALVLGAAACLTGTDAEKIDALPHPTWPRRECLLQTAHRFTYDRAYRAAGMTLVDADTREQFADAVNEKTAMIAVLARLEYERADDPDVMTPGEFLEIGHRAGVPVLVDAAAEIPPATTLTRWIDKGADLVVISGGKGIRGPQSTGILAGRRDLVEAATLHATPNNNIGRGMKVGKEEIIGLLVALDRYLGLDHEAVRAEWARKAGYIAGELQGISGLTAELAVNGKGFTEVELDWDEAIIPMTPAQVREALEAGDPRIACPGRRVITRCMRNGEEVLVARRLRRFFSEDAPRGS